MEFIFDDGGREAAGFRGRTGDCVTRALTIANDEDYRVVYDELTFMYRAHAGRRYPKAAKGVTVRDGVPRAVYDPWLADRGWLWTPTMQIGSGTTVHMRAEELPTGRLIVRLSKHLAAVVDGVLHDIGDCSRDGTRCVYGYWTQS